MKNENITLDEGGGGYKSGELISGIRKILGVAGKNKKWKNCEDDGAVFSLGREKLVFTTDAYIVDPIFFPGGDIGKIAMSGTINDLSVMGARPIGISLSIVMEEGFPKSDLEKIIRSIATVSKESGVPVVTGDTKVTEKGKIDKIEITTAGVGLAENVISNNGVKPGDFIIASGDLGEHAVALLAKRFNYKTRIKSDSKPLDKEIEKVGKWLSACKDPTRGGLAAILNEMAEKSRVKIILDEETLPYKKEVVAVTELLGLDIFSLASEGRFVASVLPENVEKVLKILKKFNPEAKIIGRAENGKKKGDKREEEKKGKPGVYLKTNLGSLRPIEMPKGKLVPRIC
ncbi:MAG: hydrogenase expression/formation protein HypE [Candidatus Moranbacteria bacterium]|jgi:hydrogenase expression/formation protein HypE|nr:hydrogenase expression/formation protein HypE [Candidatus Moranbacteria bacterium]